MVVLTVELTGGCSLTCGVVELSVELTDVCSFTWGLVVLFVESLDGTSFAYAMQKANKRSCTNILRNIIQNNYP